MVDTDSLQKPSRRDVLKATSTAMISSTLVSGSSVGRSRSSNQIEVNVYQTEEYTDSKYNDFAPARTVKQTFERVVNEADSPGAAYVADVTVVEEPVTRGPYDDPFDWRDAEKPVEPAKDANLLLQSEYYKVGSSAGEFAVMEADYSGPLEDFNQYGSLKKAGGEDEPIDGMQTAIHEIGHCLLFVLPNDGQLNGECPRPDHAVGRARSEDDVYFTTPMASYISDGMGGDWEKGQYNEYCHYVPPAGGGGIGWIGPDPTLPEYINYCGDSHAVAYDVDSENVGIDLEYSDCFWEHVKLE